MIRKIAYSEDYIITMEDSGRIRTYKACCNTAGALREIAEQNGFYRDPEWTNRAFACKLLNFLIEKKQSRK